MVLQLRLLNIGYMMVTRQDTSQHAWRAGSTICCPRPYHSNVPGPKNQHEAPQKKMTTYLCKTLLKMWRAPQACMGTKKKWWGWEGGGHHLGGWGGVGWVDPPLLGFPFWPGPKKTKKIRHLRRRGVLLSQNPSNYGF